MRRGEAPGDAQPVPLDLGGACALPRGGGPSPRVRGEDDRTPRLAKRRQMCGQRVQRVGVEEAGNVEPRQEARQQKMGLRAPRDARPDDDRRFPCRRGQERASRWACPSAAPAAAPPHQLRCMGLDLREHVRRSGHRAQPHSGPERGQPGQRPRPGLPGLPATTRRCP